MLYSKYEEMKAIEKLLSNYAQNNKVSYEEALRGLKEKTMQIVPNIENGLTQAKDLALSISLVSDYSSGYAKAKGVLSELSKAIMCYEMSYTPENFESGIVARREQEAKKLFYQLRTQNEDYKSIIGEISYDMIVSHDKYMEGLVSLGPDAKIEQLEQLCSQGELSKEQLIIYTYACDALSTHPDYLEWANQSQKSSSPIHR